MTRVADIQLQLRKTDPQKAKYDILIQVDDNKLEKNDRTANEPVPFLVGRDKLRYELVVNVVEADRVRGYLSSPKELFNPNISLIHVPSARFVLQLSRQSLIDHRTVFLAPTPHGRVIDSETALGHYLFNISEAQRESQVPTDTRDDDFGFEVTSSEKCGFAAH
jgi:hypothetical protein